MNYFKQLELSFTENDSLIMYFEEAKERYSKSAIRNERWMKNRIAYVEETLVQAYKRKSS